MTPQWVAKIMKKHGAKAPPWVKNGLMPKKKR